MHLCSLVAPCPQANFHKDDPGPARAGLRPVGGTASTAGNEAGAWRPRVRVAGVSNLRSSGAGRPRMGVLETLGWVRALLPMFRPQCCSLCACHAGLDADMRWHCQNDVRLF